MTTEQFITWLIYLSVSIGIILILMATQKTKAILIKKLRVSESNYKHIFDENPGIICKHNLQGVLLFVNDATINIFGYSRVKLLSLNIQDLLHTDLSENGFVYSYNDYINSLQLNKSATGFVNGISHGGETILLYYKSIITEAEDGEGQVLCFMQDMSDLLKVEQLRNKHQKRAKQFLNALPDIIIHLDAEGTILFINQSILFSDPATQTGRNLREYSELTELEIRFNNSKTDHHNSIGDDVVFFQERGFQCRIVPIQLNNTSEYIIILTDITDKLKRKKELNESQQKLNSLIHTVPGIIYTINLKSTGKDTIYYLNNKIEDIIGYSSEDIKSGKVNWFDLILKEDLQKVKESIQPSQQNPLFSVEYRIRHQDGKLRWVLNQGLTIFEDDAAILRHGVILDITASKNNSLALLEREKELSLLISSLNDIVLTVDKYGYIQKSYSKEDGMPGFKSADLINKHITEAFAATSELELQFRDAFEEAITINQAIEFDFQVIQDDHKFWFRARITILNESSNATILISDITSKKTAEVKLKESEDRLKFILSVGSHVLYASNMELQITYLSQSIKPVLGYNPGDFMNQSSRWESLIHPDDLSMVLNRTTILLIQRQLTQEYRLKHADGNWRWIRDQQFLIVDLEGNPKEIFGTCIDITDRKVTELNLVTSNKELEELKYAINASSIVSITDSMGYIKYANDKFEHVSQFKMEELIGKKHNIINSGYHSQKFWKNMWRTINNGEVWKAEVRNRAKDGSFYWVDTSIVPIKDVNGNIIEFISIRNEITEKKKNEDQLELLSLIAKNTSNYVIITDVQGNIEWVNESFEKFTGYQFDEIKGKKPGALLQGEETDKATVAYMSERIKQKKNFSCEIINYTKKGEKYWVSINVKTIKNKDGEVLRFFALMHNITEQKLMVRNLTHALLKAEESDKLKAAFIANLSHEIRTPMNAIMGFAELLSRPVLSTEKREEFTKHIQQRSHDLLNIVNNILDVSKIESGQMPLLPVVGNIQELFENLFHTFSVEISHIQKKNLEIRIYNELKDVENIVLADFPKLSQVLNNLINNAIKFTEQGIIEFGCRLQDNETLLFSVRDTGIGIAPGEIELIFKPFQQASVNTHQKYGGTGLGLAIIKGLLNLWGGQIWLESEPGKGSTFYFTMPYYPQSKNSLIETPALEEINWVNEKILVVENDIHKVNYLREILMDTHCQVFHADSGGSCIGMIENIKPSVVILNLEIADMSALNVAERLKALHPDINLVSITSSINTEYKTKALEVGCLDVLNWPVKQETLLQILTPILSKN